jgi:hypothetical protein
MPFQIPGIVKAGFAVDVFTSLKNIESSLQEMREMSRERELDDSDSGTASLPPATAEPSPKTFGQLLNEFDALIKEMAGYNLMLELNEAVRKIGKDQWNDPALEILARIGNGAECSRQIWDQICEAAEKIRRKHFVRKLQQLAMGLL